MIRKLSHASVYVIDQESAKDFYVNKLGLEEKMCIPISEDAFWITVAPKDQPDFEITLMPINKGGMFPPEVAKNLTDLVSKGTFGFGVFECEDIYATFEELKGKGVEFSREPTEQFYGIEAMMKDDSGNWFSLVQRTDKQLLMNIALKINWILTVVLSIATALFKLTQQDADIALFEKIGFNETGTTILGAIQLIGGVLLILSKTRTWGAYLMIPTFIVASIAVFANDMMAFGVASLVFIVMALLVVYMENRKPKVQ